MPALRVKMLSLAPAAMAGITGTPGHMPCTVFSMVPKISGDKGEGGDGLKVPDMVILIAGSAMAPAMRVFTLSALSPGSTRHCTVASALDGSAFSCTPAL